ncbi:fungal specific transcription factor domain protein [Aspergillus bombycis]|uniref:Fungal specific transcription factor domain protein n=1 Tax=Aspergillus bombycis TaxID=109264 RepID=A0A1F8AFD6_9EURO|nr:fungal specific transcription factor domain protein [Aspergillus bombycis]OGM50055.1 fungal specific transcription factor domain protein [Aspergillus bombycis]
MESLSPRNANSPHTLSYTRPYRSKRHPPCDPCRRKKLRCQAERGNACQRCQTSGSLCTFGGLQAVHQPSTALPDANQASPPSAQRVTAVQPVEELNVAVNTDDSARCQSEPILPLGPSAGPDSGEVPSSEPVTTAPATYHFPERPPAQAIQTLDQLHGFSYQVIGASGESDPWLLRHCKFDDHGFLLFHQVHFRNAGGVPLDEKIPVHFLVTTDELYGSTKNETAIPRSQSLREELNSLVPLDCGQKLVALFVKFIFPTLPVISRSLFGLTSTRITPDQHVLNNMPVHLLAAIYASAQPFTKFDEYLSVLNAYSTPPTEQLWRIVWEILLQEIHTPHLAALQAGLLYLHKAPGKSQSAVADSASVWSFVGLLVGLATSLGLQLECGPMGLPAWERRLRRRLWWAIYAEDKWRSLLMGRPPYIRHDEWDVTELDDNDFHIDETQIVLLSPPSSPLAQDVLHAQQFQCFARLSLIAESALRSSQRLSSNFSESLKTARPLLQKLREWYVHIPAPLRLHDRLFASIDGTGPQLTCLHFAYTLLEVFIFRALLRPMVRSATPPPLFEETEASTNFTAALDDYIFHIMESDEIEPTPAIDLSNENGAGSAVLKAAENCAAKMLRLVMRMAYSDLAGYWFSWSRIGFATVSSFILLLLVQAPSKDHAIRARRLVHMWRQALRRQSEGSSLMNLALVRLDGIYWTGLCRNYYLPKHVKEALDETVYQ